MTADGGLRVEFRKHLRWDWQAIESGITGAGIPDSNYCAPPPLGSGGGGVEGWVEFKKTDGLKVTFQRYQVPWIMRRVRAGGSVHVAVRQKGEVLWLFHGSQAADLEAHGLAKTEPIGRWTQPWDWEEVGALILRRPFTRGLPRG